MAIRFALSQSQAQALHAATTAFVAGVVMYLSDAIQHMAAGGPAVIIRSLIVGALVGGLAKGLGAWVRHLSDAP